MSTAKLFVHAVWATKHRTPWLTPQKLHTICDHIEQNALQKNILIDTIGGHLDHIHVLLQQNKQESIVRHMQLLKGESAWWANRNGFLDTHFEWCPEYFADSVSRGALAGVRRYIRNQATHHATTRLPDELKRVFRLRDEDLPDSWEILPEQL